MLGNSKIIGIAGTFASGKDTLAHHLADNFGFLHISLGDLIREETRRLYGRDDRPILFEHANKLRDERGGGALLLLAIETYKKKRDGFPGGLVISGVRSLGEAEELKKAGGTLVFVDAPIEVRYERAYSRQRDVEKGMSLEDFKASEAKEFDKGPDNKTDQNIGQVKLRADFVLMNGESLEDFLAEARRVLDLS